MNYERKEKKRKEIMNYELRIMNEGKKKISKLVN